ncbi:hypothetical protein [Planococcus sp. YIM B11945]|uniref:hypothetical protein n=1 Tax=Planococcus sp. YIM B11945 TaxID=3435410 RepID=UPI003D7DC840
MDWKWTKVDELEAAGKYKAALDIMTAMWKEEPLNLKVFLRLGFLSWYVIAEWGVLGDTNLEEAHFEELERLLKELTAFGFTEFNEEAEFLWLFGYMISLFPYLFDTEEELGNRMINAAHNLKPEDPVIHLIYLKSFTWEIATPEQFNVQKAAGRVLAAAFEGNGEIQRYFKEVLR